MIIRLLSTLAIVVVALSASISQDHPKEFLVRLSGTDDVDFIWYRQSDSSHYRKIRLSSITGEGFLGDDEDIFSVGFDLSTSKEKRVDLGNGFVMYRGFEFGIGVSYLEIRNYTIRLSPYIGYTFGLKYDITSRLAVSVDMMPRLRLTSQIIDNDYSTTSLQFIGIRGTNLGLGMRYGFGG